MHMIPRSVKVATIVGMGMQIALVGMTSVNLVVANKETIVGLGDMNNYRVWLSFTGLILIGSLLYHQVEGGILIGLGVITVVTWYIENSYPTTYVSIPNFAIDTSQFLNLSSSLDIGKCLPGIAAFTFIGNSSISFSSFCKMSIGALM